MASNIVKVQLQNQSDAVTIEVTSNVNAVGSCLIYYKTSTKFVSLANIKLKDDVFPDIALIPLSPAALKKSAISIQGLYKPLVSSNGIIVTYTIRQGGVILIAITGTNPIIYQDTTPIAPVDLIQFS